MHDAKKVSLAYTEDSEWRDARGQWFRSYGNEMWAFDQNGLMRQRFASINDTPIQEADRRLS